MFKTLCGVLCALGLAFASSASGAAEKGTDWNIQVTDKGAGDNSGWHIDINSTTHYGSGSPRIVGSGKQVERDRSLSGFSKVKTLGPLDVKLHQASADRVRVVADDNIEPLVDTRIEGDTLVIELKRNASFSTHGKLLVMVDFKSLAALSMNGSGDVELDRISGPSFSAALTGSGDLHIGDADVAQFSGSISGSGDMQVAGKAATQSWSVAGSGDVEAGKLNGHSVKVSVAGSGDVAVGSADSLEVSIAGSGDVTYTGKPALKTSVVGSGSVSAR